MARYIVYQIMFTPKGAKHEIKLGGVEIIRII